MAYAVTVLLVNWYCSVVRIKTIRFVCFLNPWKLNDIVMSWPNPFLHLLIIATIATIVDCLPASP
jgi:hypothetical protein